MSNCNPAGDSKVVFSLSSNKKKRKLEPSSPAADFQNEDEEKKKREERPERTEPLVIPLTESHKMTLLERKRKTQDELAAEVLTQSAVDHFSGKETTKNGTNFSAKGDLVISSGQNTNATRNTSAAVSVSADKDKQQYLKELESLPDEADDEAYDRVPIGEFGAALLRGMGWNGGNSSSTAAPPPPSMRPHRLGLGATPKQLVMDKIPGKIRTADQVKRDDKLQQQQAGYDKQRQERIAHDKQQTLQIGSLVQCQGRRAKLLQLTGVPGLSRVLVQFERDATKTSAKKGEISLIPRSELDERPFRDVELEQSQTQKPETKFKEERQRVPDETRSRDDDRRDRKHREDRSHHDERKESKKPRRRDDDSGWLIPNIRVRVITKKLGSNQYKEKGVVIDVTRGATLQMSNGQMLDRVPERYLETALPKVGGNVVVLAGKSKFAKGKLLERDSKSGKGVVQVFEDMSILKLSLDDLAEWIGPLDDDMME